MWVKRPTERFAFARVLLALAVIASTSVADDSRSTEWTTLAPGLWYRPWTIEASDQGMTQDAHVIRADPRVVHMTVVDARQPGRTAARAATLRSESHAYVVVNGGFFDENAHPLGLLVGDGKEMSPLRKVDQGIFLIAMGKPIIQHTSEPLPSAFETALQSGPRLVVKGRALHLKPQVSRRTSICLPGDGTVMLVVFPTPISLSDLAENLARPAADGGLGCWSALNLDGGPSTQLSVVTPALHLEVEGGWGVPNGLAISPKSAPPAAPPS
jgi:uncharacterized protein YigE (DUF2233 family)